MTISSVIDQVFTTENPLAFYGVQYEYNNYLIFLLDNSCGFSTVSRKNRPTPLSSVEVSR